MILQLLNMHSTLDRSFGIKEGALYNNGRLSIVSGDLNFANYEFEMYLFSQLHVFPFPCVNTNTALVFIIKQKKPSKSCKQVTACNIPCCSDSEYSDTPSVAATFQIDGVN